MRLQHREAVNHTAHKVCGLLRCDIGIGCGVKQGFGSVTVEPLGVLRRPSERQQLAVFDPKRRFDSALRKRLDV